jgi:hypothetical protein
MIEQSIGIMEGAFFVPKGEILGWVNGLLALELTRIEQLGTGAVYCQLFDVISPGKIKMGKVNWRARNEWEFLDNLRLLQAAFKKCNIKKHIEMEKLSRAKYQDNLEFAQWFKRFYDLNPSKQEYNALERRHNNTLDVSFLEKRMPAPRKREVFSSSKSPKRYLQKNRDFSLAKGVSAKRFDSALEEIAEVLHSQMIDGEKLKKIEELVKDRKTTRDNTDS